MTSFKSKFSQNSQILGQSSFFDTVSVLNLIIQLKFHLLQDISSRVALEICNETCFSCHKALDMSSHFFSTEKIIKMFTSSKTKLDLISFCFFLMSCYQQTMEQKMTKETLVLFLSWYFETCNFLAILVFSINFT